MDGRLLVATTDGRLQVRDDPYGETSAIWERDLSAQRPEPAAPPREAAEW